MLTLTGTYTPPAVLATSYGYDEAWLSPSYEKRQCTEYQKLALAGVTVVFSAGDYGRSHDVKSTEQRP